MENLAIDYRSPRTLAVTAVFIAVVVLVGAVIGLNSNPDAWYEALTKPPFNPPNGVFAPVWFVLYLLIGFAGARSFLRDPSSPAFFLWILQMLLNWAWSPTWFTLHNMWGAFAIIIGVLATVVAFILQSWKPDRLAALSFLPYALWVAFATTLNLSIAMLN